MDNPTVNYSFAYYTKGNTDIASDFAIDDNAIRNLTYDSAITWDAVLRDFISFLSSIYGYDIGEQVDFKNRTEKYEDLTRKLEAFDEWCEKEPEV
jgi:hypothetical protein